MQAFKNSVWRSFGRSIHIATLNFAPIAPINQNDSRRIVIEPLNRDLVTVTGVDSKAFLQGLITNDMNHLEKRGAFGSIFALFLNKSGRILYDTIIYNGPEENTYLLECDQTLTNDFRKYMSQFVVRRKVDINAEQKYSLWVAFSPENRFSMRELDNDTHVTLDPRLPALGSRIFASPSETISKMFDRFVVAGKGVPVHASVENSYLLNRYKNGVGEGMEELPPAKCFPHEANADYLHGVSFQKGCYVGQELTARTQHTGVVRKRLMPLRSNVNFSMIGNEVTTDAGYKVGVVRGLYGNYALALVNVEKALKEKTLYIEKQECQAIRPNWWPTESSNLRKSAIERVSANNQM